MERLISGIIVVMLGGCASPSVYPTPTTPEMTRLIAARDDEKCKELGAVPGTDAYANCRLKLEEFKHAQAMKTQEYAQRDADRKRQADADAISQLTKVKTPPLQIPKTTTTQCDSNPDMFGNVSTTCRTTE